MNILSAGFNFDDEIPDGLTESPDPFRPLTELLRSLWVYRLSLVNGKPRPDLAHTSEWTRRLAPQWAGFAPDRCSAIIQSVVGEVRVRDVEFARDIEPLEARLRRTRDIGNKGADGAGIAKVARCSIETK